jgi:penicillin-binding protein 1C
MQRPSECVDLDGFATLALSGGLRQNEHGNELPPQAPHLARKVLTQAGQKFRSSLNADLQNFATESLRRHLSALAKQNAQDGAVVVIDNASGEILAWVGSSGDLSMASEVDGVTALRQAGSTLKPFLYALAFEKRNLTPASLIEDAPLTLDTGNGLYAPQNYEPHYRGWVSARMALGGSLNVPAVKTLVRLSPDAFQQRLRLNGFASLKESGDWYGYSLALGSADVSPLMLANAYRTLANEGRWSPLRIAASKDNAVPCKNEGCAGVFTEKTHAVFTPAAAYLVGNILSDRSARAGTFGLESWLATPYWSAVKTGTSKDMRDNWCAGFSRKYTVAVWVGNAGGDPMHDVSGISGAAPVWREVMDWLHRGDASTGRPAQTSRPPTPPAGVVETAIRFEQRSKSEAAAEPPRQEWFIAGTETAVIKPAVARSLARIEYPADGTVLALDPDIPPQRQRLPLRLSGASETAWRWQMDKQILGTASKKVLWLPQPGKHRLALLDKQGVEVDAVNFEVRALKGKAR